DRARGVSGTRWPQSDPRASACIPVDLRLDLSCSRCHTPHAALARRATGSRTRATNTPCNVTRTAPQPRAVPCVSPRVAACRAWQRQQDSNADQQGCTQMHADGPESGTVVVADPRRTAPEGSRGRAGPSPIRVHLRASLLICVWIFLARGATRHTLPSPAGPPARDARARTPCNVSDPGIAKVTPTT